MKRLVRWLGLFLIMLIPFQVKALAGGSISLDCPNKVNSGQTFTCKVLGSISSGEVSSLSAKVSLSSNLELVSFTNDGDFQGNGDDGKIELYTDNNRSGNFGIGTIKIRVKDGVYDKYEKIDVTSVKYYDESFKGFDISNTSKEVKITSIDNYLSSLTVSQGSLSPSFNKEVTNYKVSGNFDSIFVGATSSSKDAQVSGVGSFSLKYGVNKLEVKVTSESGSTRSYYIEVTRTDNRNTDNSLSTLKVVGYDIDFSSGKLEYSLDVASDVSSLKIKASLNNSKASFVDGYGPLTVKLNSGSNRIEIKVKAENGSVRTYVINVNRALGENVGLTNLDIGIEEVTFDKNVFNYEARVLYEVEKLEVKYEVEDGYTVEIIGNEALEVGENQILVKVKGNGVEDLVYTFNVTRLEEGESLVSSSLLESLTVKGYKLDFDKNTFEYYLKINNDDKLEVEAKAEDEKALVNIHYPNEFKSGREIVVTVFGSNGETSEYVIVLMGQSLSGLYLGLLGVGLMIVGVILYFIVVKKKIIKVS